MKKLLFVLIALVAVAGLTVAVVFANSGPGQEKAEEARKKHTESLMKVNGVVGVGLGKGVVVVMTRHGNVKGIPSKVDDVPINILVVGEITAKCHRGWSHGRMVCTPTPPPATATPGPTSTPVPGPTCEDTKAHYRPSCTGISTGHFNITACTIAARVTDGVSTFALSNNHCYADSNAASIGDVVLQPGPFDGGSVPTDNIGTLSAFKVIDFSGGDNVIDAAIALVAISDLNRGTPSPAGYGLPKSLVVQEFVGQSVMKFGRTTQLTTGSISAIHATVNVGYGEGRVALYVDQIIITPGSFASGGDSGSLVVTSPGRNPVGLYFAGSSTVGVANPIDSVLAEFGITIEGE